MKPASAVTLLALLVALAACPAQSARDRTPGDQNPGGGGGQAAVPHLARRVTDLAGTLSPEQTGRLESALGQFERQTSNQIVILVVPSLGGEPIEEYSLRVSEENRLGKKGKDNGVLLLVATGDRKARIEVGYGLEGALTDAVSSRIIRREMSPYFQKGEIFEGLVAGSEAIMAATKGEYTADDNGPDATIRKVSPVIVILFFLLFGIFSSIARRVQRTYMGPGRVYTRGPWFGGPSSWGGGGFGGGFGGGGGGGFSGGGGSFGGGGASGSW